jgi:DNA-binding NtrC family response regulator
VPRRVVVLDPPEHELEPLCEALEGRRTDVQRVHSAGELEAALDREAWDLVLLDQDLGDGTRDGMTILVDIRKQHPEVPIVIVAERGNVERANAAIQAGAHDFLVRGERLGQRVATQITKLRRQLDLMEENRRLREASTKRTQLITRSPALRELVARLERMARVPRPLLIVGERGTGKELLAHALHERSGLRGPFVAVNCAAFTDTLLDAELFGHEQGAFTGADRQRPGKFELAHRGTLFLDEVAHMSLPFQQKVLRTIEYGTLRRVGGDEEVRVTVRIIAATNADLTARVAAGSFLSDLLDRLSFEVLRVPPLRERPEDIEPLAEYFLAEFAREVPELGEKRVTPEALAMLRDYHFPGNVRELKHIVERAAYRDTSSEIDPRDIGELSAAPRNAMPAGSFKERTEAFEREIIAEALEAAGDNQQKAAKALGLAYHQFRYYRKKYGL